MPTLEEFAASFNSWIWASPLFFLLLTCGLAFSVLSKFIQWRILTHGIGCVRGIYDDPNDTGHISHFQALCAALSATIGLGNIAGVAVAVSIGGPGAVFWMWVVGVFGMALKFMECTLAVMYRDVRDVPDPSAPALMEKDAESRTLEYEGEEPPLPGAKPTARGEVRGGPMWYMQKALVDPLKARGNGLWVVFKALAVLFAISTMLNSFGGGNMFQGWNVADMLHTNFAIPTYGAATVVSIFVAMVIIGGIKRIGQVAGKLVPFMCVVYVLGASYVVALHASEIPYYLSMIVKSAFTTTAGTGGFAGATIWLAFQQGLRRACFSNEAGEGSAAMAHAAARTDEPIREGVVAGIGPFVDTIVICTMSALVILMTGAWQLPAVGTVSSVQDGRAIVTCNSDLDTKYQSLYLSHLQKDGVKLRVQLVRSDTTGVEDVAVPVESLAIGDGGDWSDAREIVLDLRGVGSGDTDKANTISIGHPVHLNVAGAAMTGFAFDTVIPGFGKYMVTFGVCLFAFSTMISWSYYGEKGAEYIFGPKAVLPYKFIFVVFVFLGMVLPNFKAVYDFSDATTGMMVMCNLPAVLILSPVVLRAARDYFRRLDKGEMPPTR